MRFRDREEAGRLLAQRLLHLKDTDPVVLALPRGGVPVAYEIAHALRLPLDVFLVRKIGVPRHPDLEMGAKVFDAAGSPDSPIRADGRIDYASPHARDYGGRLTLRIFESRYMDMAKACLKDGSPFGVCLILEGGEVGTPATPAAG